MLLTSRPRESQTRFEFKLVVTRIPYGVPLRWGSLRKIITGVAAGGPARSISFMKNFYILRLANALGEIVLGEVQGEKAKQA